MRNRREKPKPDQRTLEALQQTFTSYGWAKYRERIDVQLSRELRALEDESTHDETIRRRAVIATLRSVSNIPGILLTEAREALKSASIEEE